MNYSKYIFILLTFFATISVGLWVEWIQDEGILIMDIPLVLLYIFGRKRVKVAPGTIPVLVLVIMFFIWSHISIFFAVNKLLFRQEAVENVRVLLIFLSLLLFVNTKEDLQYVFFGFAIGLTFQSLVGIHQWLRGPVGLKFLGEHWSLAWQAQGTFVHPSIYGMYVSLITILSYRFAVFIRPKYHYLYIAAFFLGCIALYASLNRATWLAFVFAMTAMFAVDLRKGFLKKRKVRKFIVLIALAACVGAVRYGSQITARFSDAEESLMSERTSSRKNLALDAIRIIREHPTLGVGLHNYIEFANPETAGTRVVHCTYLLIAAELGIPGLILFLALITSFGIVGIRGMKSRDPYLRNISAALVTAMLSFAIAILPSPDYRILYVKNHIWMIWALVLVVAKIDYHQQIMIKKKRISMKKKSQKKAVELGDGERFIYEAANRSPDSYPSKFGPGKNI